MQKKVTERAGKPLRSQATRDRILNEARRLFAERGYERTTIRAIAEAAKINVSMVMRYYGSKEELFATAAHLDLQVPDLKEVPQCKRGEAIVERFLERWEGADAGDQLPALMRAASTHESARQRAIELIMEQAGAEIRSVVSGDQFEERLGLVITQLAGLAFSRYVLKHPLVMALDRKVIVQRLGATLQRYLAGKPQTVNRIKRG